MTSAMKSPSVVASFILAGLMFAQSVLGLGFPGAYRDPLWAFSAWHGNDFVTLLVGVPLLVVALVLVRRGSPRGRLLWLGMLGYGVYNYSYYLFGAALNAFFPIYVALFVLSVVALLSALAGTDAAALASRFRGSTAVRVAVGGYLAFIGFGLLVAWIAQWAAYLVAGRVPDIGVDAFRLVAALDLSLMSPALLAGGILLMRRHPWGPVVAAIAGVQGGTYTLVLTVASWVAAGNGVAGTAAQIPVWGACTLLTGAAMALLFAGVRGGAERGAAEGIPSTSA